MDLTRAELGSTIRQLMRSCRSATLSTRLANTDGWPYGSLVTVAIDNDVSPLLLFSTLADHTRNLAVDERASLLFEQASRHGNPQRGSRVTILGNIRRTNKPEHGRRFLDIHPEAEMYAGFSDFSFFRMNIDRAHWVGGFAKAQWLSGRFVKLDTKAAKALKEAAPGIIEHMNEDHADTIDLYARKLLKRRGRGWRMVDIDLDGADLALGSRRARLAFAEPMHDANEACVVLAGLAARARA